PLLEKPRPFRDHLKHMMANTRRRTRFPDQLVHRPSPLHESGGKYSAPAFQLVPSVLGPGLGGAKTFP
ncbi:MAG: hypothetical protein ACKPKO_12595, partial [Candidatus Fonsibacter sp.]